MTAPSTAEPALPRARVPADERAARPRIVLLPEGWPLVALLGLFPLWWAIGLAEFIWPLLALPMVISLIRRRRIRVPPFFGIWLLLLAWMLAGSLALGVEVSGTVHTSFAHELPAYLLRLGQYVAATVMLLYVGNLNDKQFSRDRLIRLLGIFFLYVLAGGLVGLLWPGLAFSTPMEVFLDKVFAHGAWNTGFIADLTHAHVADVQDVLGYTAPRPSAPFPYTNTWGYVVSILVLWFVTWLWPTGSVPARTAVLAALGMFTVLVVASLNRGVWIGMVGVMAYLGLRLLTRRRAVTMVAVLCVAAVVGFASPLADSIRLRLDHPHSNAGRLEQATAAVQNALGSPVLGYGSTRTLVGNTRSIAVGATQDCPLCGGIAIGSAGEFWLLLFANGFVGAGLFVAYLLTSLWAHRRDKTAIGIAGRITVLLSLLYTLFYDAAGAALSLTLVAIALLWRNQRTGLLVLPSTARTSPGPGFPSVRPDPAG
jgi:hypothetical protein